MTIPTAKPRHNASAMELVELIWMNSVSKCTSSRRRRPCPREGFGRQGSAGDRADGGQELRLERWTAAPQRSKYFPSLTPMVPP
jgi:hypothetical protein